jgi:mono/diheme cytochrome c family protein
MKAFWRRHSGALALGAAVCLVAAGAIYADLEIGYYAPETLGSITQPAPVAQRIDAAYKINAFPLYQPELAPGEGRQDVEAYCNTCHSPDYILMQPPLPAATWEAEVTKMGKAYGAQIPPESQANILKYLQTHYTPETRKR